MNIHGPRVVVLMANSGRGISEMRQELSARSKEKRLKINAAKTKVVKVSFEGELRVSTWKKSIVTSSSVKK